MAMKARCKGPAVKCVCESLPLSVYGFCLVLFSLITVQVLKTTHNLKNASHCAVIPLYKGSNPLTHSLSCRFSASPLVPYSETVSEGSIFELFTLLEKWIFS